ncbi:hypothetical protein FPRO04_07001 [Fusarium proliferatum]|uniref:Uncharacterized protein n=1 Tax=Gibberella intermedia TaxID=948311 RepID=A0A420T2P6_GIBIN|nr:hypothetical protein FPRO03_08400 [Fusarium proliferatum]KAG4277758.1 hypothetical protein FPRO04_07001 [Fusarium proliferatum]RKL35805.1 hypothetical protein BFJ72_g8505 [Fusarium proliferatum]
MSELSLDQQDAESISSVDSFDPAPTLVQKTITRDEALEQASENIAKMGKSKFVDKLLKPAVSKWLTEPILRVLPPEMKHTVRDWCLSHDPMWFNKLSEFIDDDTSEWEYTVEVPNRRKDMAWCGMGADILRFYVADLKPLRNGLPELERREVVNKVRRGVALFADFHDEKMKAMEQEAHDLVQQERESMEIERSAFATAFELQNEAIAD